LADLSSTYPRTFGVLGLQRYLTAQRVEPVEVTGRFRHLAARPDLSEAILDPHLWFELGVTLVRLPPRGDLLPVKLPGRSTVGSLDLGGDTAWYHWPDVLAAAVRADQPPEIVEAIHLQPCDPLTLKPVRLPTGRVVDLDREDLADILDAERDRIRSDPGLSPAQRKRQTGLVKLLASSLCFGILARTDRVSGSPDLRDTAVAPDGTLLVARQAGVFERPGPYCWLPAAGAVCAATRLLMAATIDQLESAGGAWMHIAADSLLIAATHETEPATVELPGGQNIRLMALDQVEQILDWLDPLLQPEGGHAWKREAGWDTPMVGYVSGVNLFGLVDPYTRACQHVTEVGLGGVFADPTGTAARTPEGHWAWAVDLHGVHLQRQTGRPDPLPAWADQPALRPGRASNPDQLAQIQAHLGAGVRPYTRWVMAHDQHGTDLYALPGVEAAGWRRNGQPTEPGRLRTIGHELLAHTGGLRPDRGPVPPIAVSTRLVWAQVVGKEWDAILTAQLDPLADPDTDITFYQPIDTWTPIRDEAKKIGAAQLATRSGLPISTVRHVLAGRRPQRHTAARLRETLARDGTIIATIPPGICQQPGCGRRTRGARKYCSERCRQAVQQAHDALLLVPHELRPGLWVWSCPHHGPIQASRPRCPLCPDRPRTRRARRARDFLCPGCGASCGPVDHCLICPPTEVAR
jgi:hypothetical protein